MSARLNAQNPKNNRLTFTDDATGNTVELSLHNGDDTVGGAYIWATISGVPFGFPLSRRDRVALRNMLNNNEPVTDAGNL